MKKFILSLFYLSLTLNIFPAAIDVIENQELLHFKYIDAVFKDEEHIVNYMTQISSEVLAIMSKLKIFHDNLSLTLCTTQDNMNEFINDLIMHSVDIRYYN